MPKIPGVPGLDPVNHPSANPSEFGRGGAAVAQMGDAMTDITLQQQGLDLYMKKAQEHVDTLAARNQLDAAYADIQNQLAKTPNSRDVPDVIANGNKTLNDISARWSKSPAAVAIQMDADGLRPSLSHVGTVRQVDLMGKEFKTTIDTQAERLAGPYAETRASRSSKNPAGSTNYTVGPKPKGMVEEGNLPIWNRPTVQNADGSHSSELSFSREENGKEVLVPAVVDGRFATPDGKMPPLGREVNGKYVPTPEEQAMQDRAWEHYKKTGENLGKFSNPDDADAYAEALHNRGEGIAENPAETAFNQAVDGGVKTGLVGDIQADEIKRQFRQKGQELQIKNAITNANPEVNQKIYETIAQHRDEFPDVTQEQLDTYKGQALAAFEAHTKFQDWAEGEMARKTMLVPKIDQFTNPATGIFDEGAAMKDNADRFAAGEITETQSNVLAAGFSAHQAQLQVGMRKEADKRLDDIETDLSRHDFRTATAKLQETRPWFEDNGFGDKYRAAMNYVLTSEREVRAEESHRYSENRQNYLLSRQIAQEQSADTLGEVQHFIAGGGMLTKSDLQNMAGKGKGKMLTRDVDAAWKIMDQFEKEPDFAAAMKQLDDSFAIPKSAADIKAHPERATPEYVAAQNRKYADTVELFQQEVNKHPDQSKQEIMNGLLKTKAVEDVKAHANAMFGINPPTTSHVFDSLRNFFSKPFTTGLKPGDAGYKAPEPTTIRVKLKSSGQTGTIPAGEFDDKVYEKVQ